jgi:hypothetical protein
VPEPQPEAVLGALKGMQLSDGECHTNVRQGPCDQVHRCILTAKPLTLHL